jgi:predicted RNase H-like HicB family nuclease
MEMVSMKILINMRLLGATRFDEETGLFVGFCPALKVYSQGRSKEEAEKALKQSLGLYVETCFQHNILDEVLTNSGFKSVGSGSAVLLKSAMSEYIVIQQANFDSVFDMDVPLELVAAAALEGINAGSSSHCS